MMRILWFTNLPPMNVTRKFALPTAGNEGWNDSLRTSLQHSVNLELGVASPSEIDYKYFAEDNTVFYNILRPPENGRLGSIYRRWLHTTQFSNAISDCLEIIKDFKPDLIHINGSENFYGLISKETSIPIVLSIQGILTICETFYFGGFTCKDKLIDIFSSNFIRGVGAFHKYLEMRKSAFRERQILKICKYFTGRTEFDKNFVSLINPKSQYYHCDRVLRSQFYSVDWAPEISDCQTIYCTMGSAPYKGLDCLLNAFDILKTMGFSSIRLRVGGNIQNSDIWPVIERKFKSIKSIKEVVWLGKLSPETIASELKGASIFVLPSYIDNSPNSLGEAMLVGVPSVASFSGGIPSMICHGKDGLLFQPGDSYSLAGMVAKIIRDPSLAKTLSENAKITARKRHDPQIIAATMMNIYSEIIANSNCDS